MTKMSPKGEISNPNQDLHIPSWVNAAYFQQVLDKDEPGHESVKEFTATAAIPPGENFTSVMIRVHMDLQMKDGAVKHKNYVLKTMLDDDKGGTVIKSLDLFPKEMDMYQRFLPAFEGLYKAAGEEIQLAPKCLLTERVDGRINFVFEDLCVQNFRNADRLKGLDMAHMERVLRKLAEFHAATAVYEEKNGPYPAMFFSGFVDKEKSYDFHKDTYNNRIASYKKAMMQWGLPDVEKYIAKMPTLDQYWKACLATFDTQLNNFNVLTHCDFWSSNIMFNYAANGSIDKLLIVDYQICKWGSPAEDLIFFITISAAKDIRIKEFDRFIEIYHERLVECLKLLNYQKPLPQLRELHQAMYKPNVTFYAFFALYNHLVAVMLPTDKDSNIHSLTRPDEIGDQFRMRAYTNPLFVDAMKDLFPFYHRRGLLNFHDFD